MTAFAYSETSLQTGVFVAVVGPSGVGKDTVLSHLRSRIGAREGFLFPKRIITRCSDASEELIEIDKRNFEAQKLAGAFALSWSAHGLDYAVPVSVRSEIAAGKIVVVNISRAVIGLVRTTFHRSRIVLVSAPLEMRAQRIALRGRENESDIRARLARTVDSFAESDADLILDNSGTPEDAARTLLDFLMTISPQIEA